MKKTVLFLLAILTAIYSYASTIKFIIPSGDGWESNYEVVYIYIKMAYKMTIILCTLVKPMPRA